MAAPETEKTDKASKVERPAGATPEAPPPRPAGAPKKRGGFLGKLLLSVATLAIIAGGAGYAALTFRDVDPRIGLAADYVEEGVAQAQGALDKAQGVFADLTGSPKPAPKLANPRALLEKAPLSPAPAPETAPAPPPQGASEAAPESPPAPVPAPVETAKQPEAPAPEKPVAAAPAPNRADVPEPPRKPVELAQEPTPLPPPAVEPVQPAAPAPVAKMGDKPADADGFTDRDLISALEGRLDALSDEVQTLRGKVDAPKSEARAAPETEVSKSEAEKPAPAPAAAPDTTSAAVVVAFALQRDLESGRPFAEEIAALSRLNAEPAPASVLIELSEKGAATGAQLHDAFLPIAKKLKSHETHADAHESGDIAGHILEGASKLVKVRPVGQANPESVDGKIDRIEAALARSDFASAEQIFDSLPDEAKGEAKDFGETLRQRAEAAKAADELLHGAIAALGRK